MIQGGCPNGNGMGGPGYSIKGEFNQNRFQNDLKHEPGAFKSPPQKYILIYSSYHITYCL